MRNYTRSNQGASRKSEEITTTPDRAASSRVQGKNKVGRSNTNSFAPLQTGDNDEEKEKDNTAMTAATEESGGGITTETMVPEFFRPRKSKKTRSVAIENSMGGKAESSSATPNSSVSAKAPGTPGTVSFATTTSKNETGLNRLKPTAKEKTGDNNITSSSVTTEGGKEE